MPSTSNAPLGNTLAHDFFFLQLGPKGSKLALQGRYAGRLLLEHRLQLLHVHVYGAAWLVNLHRYIPLELACTRFMRTLVDMHSRPVVIALSACKAI